MVMYALTEEGRALVDLPLLLAQRSVSCLSRARRCQLGGTPRHRHPAGPSPAERARLERRARLLAWGGIAWHVVEFAIAIARRYRRGLDRADRVRRGQPDRGARRLRRRLAVHRRAGAARSSGRAARAAADRGSFFVLAAYVGVEAVRTLVDGHHPEASWVGIGLAAFTAPTMPLLAGAKRGVGSELHSSATVKEAAQTQLCAYLSIALLVGLGANALARLVVGRPARGARHRRRSRSRKAARAGAAKAAATPADPNRHDLEMPLDGVEELLELIVRFAQLAR